MAGKASGKSHYAGIIVLLLIQKYPKVKGFIGANTYDQLNTSTMTKVLEVWNSQGVIEWSEQSKKGCFVMHKQPPASFVDVGHNYISYKNIITFDNGATIYLGSLDNAKAHEGKEFGWGILDETKDSKEMDVKDTILTRLRQKGIYIGEDGQYSTTGKEINPLYILTSPAKVEWINKWFKLDEARGEIESIIYSESNFYCYHDDIYNIVISSTYLNQKNIPTDYINNLKLSNTKERINIIVYGSPFATVGIEYITTYDKQIYGNNVAYNNTKPLHITFDFNITPYNTCAIYQITKINKGDNITNYNKELQLLQF